MTCKDLFNDYIKEQKEKYCSGTYYPRISILKNHFILRYGDEDVDKISFEDINNIYDSMEKEGYRLFGVYAALSKFFKYALDRGYISQTPLALSRTIKPNK